MDYPKKKLLTQSVAFLQANLMINSDMLQALRSGGVLTTEEISTIQKDDTRSGKIVELVCFVKRKDNRTFNKFVQVLDETSGGSVVASLFKTKSSSECSIPDKRTMNFLEQFLRDTTVNAKTMRDLAINLVLKEIYQDDITELREKMSRLQKALRNKTQTGSFATDSDSGGNTPVPVPIGGDGINPPSTAKSRPRTSQDWDIPSSMDELKGVLKDKDDIIRKKDDEYSKLKLVLDDTQKDMQDVLDLNSQYLTIISQLNQMQMASAATPRVPTGHTEDMERLLAELEEAQSKISKLEIDLMNVESDLANKETELDKLQTREHRYKEMLGLDDDADDDDIHDRLKQIVEQGEMNYREARKMEKELEALRNNLNSAGSKVMALIKEKEKIEFHMRQQDMMIKKINRMKAGKEVIQKSEQVLRAHGHDPRTTSQLRLPAIERPGTSLSLASNKGLRSGFQYCIFCRSEFQVNKNGLCRVHFRPIRSGLWTCCRDESHRSAGCIQLRHMYVEITVDKKLFLTDGARYMEVT